MLPSVISRIGHPKGPDVLGCRPEKSGASGGRAAGCGIAGGGTVKWCAVDLLKRSGCLFRSMLGGRTDLRSDSPTTIVTGSCESVRLRFAAARGSELPKSMCDTPSWSPIFPYSPRRKRPIERRIQNAEPHEFTWQYSRQRGDTRWPEQACTSSLVVFMSTPIAWRNSRVLTWCDFAALWQGVSPCSTLRR